MRGKFKSKYQSYVVRTEAGRVEFVNGECVLTDKAKIEAIKKLDEYGDIITGTVRRTAPKKTAAKKPHKKARRVILTEEKEG